MPDPLKQKTVPLLTLGRSSIIRVSLASVPLHKNRHPETGNYSYLLQSESTQAEWPDQSWGQMAFGTW